MLPIKLATKSDDIQLSLIATAVRTLATDSAVSVVRPEQQIHNDVRVTEAPQRQVVDPVVNPIVEITRIAESPLVRQDAIRVARTNANRTAHHRGSPIAFNRDACDFNRSNAEICRDFRRLQRLQLRQKVIDGQSACKPKSPMW